MLSIDNIEKLKITKIKNWALYFEYCGEKYLLHCGSDDYEDVTKLYKRVPSSKNGYYKLEVITSVCMNGIPTIRYKNNFRGVGCTHNQIDKNKLVFELTWDDLVCGIYKDEVDKRKKYIDDINNNIKVLNEIKNKLRHL